jgi:hypothetical protein
VLGKPVNELADREMLETHCPWLDIAYVSASLHIANLLVRIPAAQCGQRLIGVWGSVQSHLLQSEIQEVARVCDG